MISRAGGNPAIWLDKLGMVHCIYQGVTGYNLISVPDDCFYVSKQ